MIKRLIEHREYQQLRRDQMRKEKIRQAMIILPVIFVILAAVAAVSAIVPAKEKPVATVSKPVSAVSSKTQDAERFADVVTMPVENLTSDDLEFLKSKENNPCYAGNVDVEQGMMAEEIMACEASQ